MALLVNLRLRRSKREGGSKSKKRRSKGSVFRGKNKTDVPSIEPALTMTLSQDSELESSPSFSGDSPKRTTASNSPTLTAAGENGSHVHEDTNAVQVEPLIQDDSEDDICGEPTVSTPKMASEESSVCPTSSSPFKSPKVEKISSFLFTKEELMANELNHMRQLNEKQQQIDKMQVVLDELKDALQEKEEELAEKYYECQTYEKDLFETKEELAKTKTELSNVGSALIKCQHELFEYSIGGLASWFGGAQSSS